MVEWAQLLAYMPQLRQLRDQVGPAVFFLPAPSLNARQHVEKAVDRMAVLAREQGRARQELIDEARANTTEWLEEQGVAERFSATLGLYT